MRNKNCESRAVEREDHELRLRATKRKNQSGSSKNSGIR
jgi:hypothetical protein